MDGWVHPAVPASIDRKREREKKRERRGRKDVTKTTYKERTKTDILFGNRILYCVAGSDEDDDRDEIMKRERERPIRLMRG